MSDTTPLKSLCVFCGAAGGAEPAHARLAERLGRLLAERRIRLIYGGGHVGIMGVLADAVLAHGGEVVGVIPGFLKDREVGHTAVTELIVVDDMHQRKRKMFELADAFAVLPGGLGTLEELFEVLTWKQIRLHERPLLIVNAEGYWDPLIHLIRHIIEQGFARPGSEGLMTVVSSAQEVVAVLG